MTRDDDKTKDSESGKQLDLMAIDFPTDEITVRHLLEIDGKQDWPTLSDSEVFQNLEATMSIEREIAQLKFRSLLEGDPRQLVTARDGLGLDEIIAMLDADYQRFGLSNGKHQTRELVRRFESQVSNQVNQRLGPD